MEYISKTTDQLMVGIMEADTVDRIMEMCRQARIPVLFRDSKVQKAQVLHTEIMMDMEGPKGPNGGGRIRYVMIHNEE